jgi:hypothetical protein
MLTEEFEPPWYHSTGARFESARREKSTPFSLFGITGWLESLMYTCSSGDRGFCGADDRGALKAPRNGFKVDIFI